MKSLQFTVVPGPPSNNADAPNQSAWATLHLKSDNYIALCFVPDPGSGKALAELGMVTPFTVK